MLEDAFNENEDCKILEICTQESQEMLIDKKYNECAVDVVVVVDVIATDTALVVHVCLIIICLKNRC